MQIWVVIDIYCTIRRKRQYYALHSGESTKKSLTKNDFLFLVATELNSSEVKDCYVRSYTISSDAFK